MLVSLDQLKSMVPVRRWRVALHGDILHSGHRCLSSPDMKNSLIPPSSIRSTRHTTSRIFHNRRRSYGVILPRKSIVDLYGSDRASLRLCGATNEEGGTLAYDQPPAIPASAFVRRIGAGCIFHPAFCQRQSQPNSSGIFYARVSGVGLAEDSRLCASAWIRRNRTARSSGQHGSAGESHFRRRPHRTNEKGNSCQQSPYRLCQQFGKSIFR